MKKYIAQLLAITAALVLASFVVLWASPDNYIVAMSWLPLYFAMLTALQHYITLKNMQRSARAFVQIFLGTTVGVLFIHLLLVVIFLISTPQLGRRFLIAFCIGYVVYLAFETISLVRYIDSKRKQ